MGVVLLVKIDVYEASCHQQWPAAFRYQLQQQKHINNAAICHQQ